MPRPGRPRYRPLRGRGRRDGAVRALVVSVVLHAAVAALLVPALVAAPGRGTLFLFAAEPWLDRNVQADRRVQKAGSAAPQPFRPLARTVASPDTPGVRPPVSDHATPPVAPTVPSHVASEPLDTSVEHLPGATLALATAPIAASVLSAESRTREVDAAIGSEDSTAAIRTPALDPERSAVQRFPAETPAETRREGGSAFGLGLASAGRAITITSPRDGHALTAEDIPAVVV